MRLAFIVPADPAMVVTLAIVAPKEAALLREAGNQVIEIGEADPLLAEGVAGYQDLVPLFDFEEELLEDLRQRDLPPADLASLPVSDFHE